MTLHHAHDLPRRGDLPRLRAAERGHARAGQRHRAEGLDLQPELPARLLRPLLPGAARGRPRAAGARAGHARTRSRPATRRTSTSSPTPASTRRRASTGSTSRSTRAPTAAGHGRDGLDSVDCLIANTRNNPIEELEWRFPMRTERYELRDDPCAAGQVARRHRHGARQPLPRRTRSSPARATATSPTRRGASSAATTALNAYARSRNPDGDGEEHWPSKFTGKHAQGRRHDRDHRAELGRLRRPARARSASSSSPTCSTASPPSSWPSATTAWQLVEVDGKLRVDADVTAQLRADMARV